MTGRLVGRLLGGACILLGAAGMAQASDLWSNGAVNTTFSSDNRCESEAGTCGNTTAWTIFDNFNIPSSAHYGWDVTGFDYSAFLVNGAASDYETTDWSIWNGDPLSGGKLVASGSTMATLSTISGTCGSGSTCLEEFTVTIASRILPPGNTYYLGVSDVVRQTNTGEATFRAFASGGNTAAGGTANTLARWEQSNGSTTGVTGSSWTAGTVNNTFPGALGVNEGSTAFDIQGTLATPEPAGLTLVGLALLAFCVPYVVRPKIQQNR